MNDLIKNRISEVIKLAEELGWFAPIPRSNPQHYSYPIMQLSEVEKCMIAMVDQEQFNQMRVWCGKKAEYSTSHSFSSDNQNGSNVKI